MDTADNNHHHLKEKTLQLSLHAFDLPRRGLFRGSPNSFARVYVYGNSEASCGHPPEAVVYGTDASARVSSVKRLLGETEIVPSSSKPNWSKVFYVDLDDEDASNIFVTVHDNVLPLSKAGEEETDTIPDNQKEHFLGAAYLKLNSILDSRDCTQAKRLPNGGW